MGKIFDDEIYMMYFIYFLLLIFLVVGFSFARKFIVSFRRYLIIFVLYALLLIIPSLNEDNMKGGSSLYFIVFGWLFLLFHLVIFIPFMFIL